MIGQNEDTHTKGTSIVPSHRSNEGTMNAKQRGYFTCNGGAEASDRSCGRKRVSLNRLRASAMTALAMRSPKRRRMRSSRMELSNDDA